MWSTPVPPVLGSLFLLTEPASTSHDNAWLWAVVPFLALVAVFVLYQQRQSGWTWGEFAEGMFALFVKALIFAGTTLLGHMHFPPDDDMQ